MPMHRRRVRNSGGTCAFTSQSAQKYIQHTVQQWLYTAMSLDDPFFACLGAVSNGLQGKARSLGSYLGNNCVRGLGERKKEALRKEIRNIAVKRYPSLFADFGKSILRTNEPVEESFEDSISVHKRLTLPALAKMFSLPERVLHRVIMEAYSCGFMRD